MNTGYYQPLVLTCLFFLSYYLDDEDDRICHDLDEKTCHSYEFNASTVDSPGTGIYSSTTQENIEIVGNEDNRITMYENTLEENAAYADLYLELEKERAAAATAADEAMAMISRLQEEKASMEMEMRQYERLIEERVSYDEEEMNIMQEILIRREKENFFLEKELESYRQMSLTESCELHSKSAEVRLSEWKRRSPLSFETYDDPSHTESTVPNVKQDCTNNTEHEELDKNTEYKDRACDDLHSSFYDTESDVLDVHVIDDGPCASKTEYDSKCKSLPFDSESDSSCLVHNERVRIDNEIEVLGERLKTVKHEKEKLTMFSEKGENEKGQLKLLDEIANRLQKIKQLRNPARGASLPPPWTKV